MAAPTPFGRMLTAMVTPFAGDGSLDLDGAATLATHLVDAGNDGLVVNGTTGESPTTTDAEQEAVIRAVAEAVGDRAHVVAGVGTNDTARIVEVKDAKDDLAAASDVIANSDLAFYSGTDVLTLPLLSVGAVGVVSVVSHVVTAEMAELIRRYADGDVAGATAIHQQLLPVFAGMFRTQGVILAKAALRLLGLPGGPVRLPLVNATDDELATLRTDLAAGGVRISS